MDVPESYSSSSYGSPYIEHYYGDIVRQLFLIAAVLILMSIPLYAELLPYALAVQTLVVVVVAIFAALTNPFKKWILVGDAVIAVLGLLAFEVAAISAYVEKMYLLFAAREALALVFLFALYFSVKTVCAMWLHQLGKRMRPSDLEENNN